MEGFGVTSNVELIADLSWSTQNPDNPFPQVIGEQSGRQISLRVSLPSKKRSEIKGDGGIVC